MEKAWAAAAGSDPAQREAAWAVFYSQFEKFGEAVWNEAVQACLKNPGDEPAYQPTLVQGENPWKGIPLPAPYPTPEERGVYGATMIDPLIAEESQERYREAAADAAEKGVAVPDLPEEVPQGGGAAVAFDPFVPAPPAAPQPPKPEQTYFVLLRTDVTFKPGAKVYCVTSPEARPRAPGRINPADIVAYCVSPESAKAVARALTLLRQQRG